MTSRTSLFNFGIYKATLRRFAWGAVLYAIILFMVTAMPILFGVDPETSTLTIERNGQLIFDDIYLYFPLVISYVVPTIVALIAFRFVHSKRMSVFVHGLPVSRGANYISTVLAALTLMLAPILINGVILMILSAAAYSACFSVWACLVWIGINALSIFLMFSVSAVSAFLTGNSFALVGINILLHCISLIFAGIFSALSNLFLYGYHMSGELLDAAAEWNFVHLTMSWSSILSHDPPIPFGWKRIVILSAVAIVLYVLAFLLYKKRRMETAEDVAAYKCLNPIFKYLLTAIVALGAFAIFGMELQRGSYVCIVIVLIASAVVYFAAEMILKKSLKIWSSYKGYLVFMAIFAAVMCVFAFTSFFGYETRVPQAEDIQSVMISQHTVYNAHVENREIIDYALDVHTKMIDKERIYTVESFPTDRSTYMYMEYKLKNGKKLVRKYPVTDIEICEIMDQLYMSKDYIEKNLGVFSVDEEDIHGISFNHSGTEIIDPEDVKEFLNCLKTDLYNLKYTQIRDHSAWSMTVGVDYIRDEPQGDIIYPRNVYSEYQRINASFVNTVAWMLAHGYKDEMIGMENLDLTVLTAEQFKLVSTDYSEKELYSYGETVQLAATVIPTFDKIPGAVRITDPKKIAEIHDYVLKTAVPYAPDKEYAYYVCYINEENHVIVLSAFYDDADVMKFVE